MGSVEGRVAIQYVFPHALVTSFTSSVTDTVCLPRYVDEKDSQSVPQSIPVKQSG